MAYKADIQLAVKGVKELKSLNIHLDRNGQAINRSNEKLLKFAKSVRSHFVPSVDNFSAALRKANANLNSVSLNSDQARKAAENLVRAENNVNDVLQQRAALIEKARGKTPGLGNEFTTSSSPFQSSRDALGRTAEEQNAILDERAKKITEINKKNKEEFALVQKALAPKVKGTKIQQEENKQINETLNLRAKELMEIRKTTRAQDKRLKIEQKLGMGRRGRFGLNRIGHNLRGRGRSAMQARENAASNALIGGAFPLLFGQGAGASAGGALGGAAGGLLGGQFGFALSLVGTQIGSIIDTFVAGTAELGRAIGPFAQDTQAVTTALGLQGSAEEARIKLIEETKGKTAAFNASMRLMATEIGQRGVDSLKRFGENTRLLTSSFTLAITKLQALGAAFANFVARITGLEGSLEAGAATRTVAAAAGEGDAEAQALVGRRRSAEAMRGQGGQGRRKKVLLDQISAEEKIFAIRRNTSIEADNLTQKFDALGVSIKTEAEETKRIAELRKQGLNPALAKTIAGIETEGKLAKDNLQVEIDKLVEKQAKVGQLEQKDQIRLTTLEGIRNEIDEQVNSLSEAAEATDKLNDKTKDMKSNFEMIGQSIASGVSDNLSAAILQTKTLGDAAKSILNDLSNTLVKLGVNTILASLPGIGGAFSALPKLGFARGGRPPTGRPSIVGERGPELFVPRRSGTIIPNDKLGGGSTNISVNVDASGSSVQGDEQQSKELGKAISAAIQSELLKQRRPGGLLR